MAERLPLRITSHLSETLRPFVSVIIPVFNDSQRLEICLRALEKQSYSRDRYEVVVVNNGPGGDINRVVAKFKAFNVRGVKEDRIGSYAARNKGLAVAIGEVIAFTDSDCIPTPDWIEKGVESLLGAHRPGLVAGRIQGFYRNPRKPTAVELYERLFYRGAKGQIQMQKFAPTANLFTFKAVFGRVGVFDTRLRSRGDFEWGQRVYSLGYQLTYADDVRVAHPLRYSFGQIYRRIIRIQGGVHDFNRVHTHSFVKSYMQFSSRLLQNTVFICRLRDLHFTQKLEVVIVLFSTKFVGSVERLRLALGGESRR